MRLLGFPNETAQPYVTVSTSGAVGLEPAQMEAALLKTEEPSERARLTTCDPAHTQWKCGTAGVAVTIAGLALNNHNVPAGGQIRFLGSTAGATLNQPVRVAANSLAQSNAAGALTSIDDDLYAPDGLFIDPITPDAPYTLQLGFPDLDDPLGGLDLMCFCVRVRQMAGSSLIAYPACFVELRESGVLIRALGHRAVTSIAGQILLFPFTLGELTNANLLELWLTLTPGSVGGYARTEVVALDYEQLALAMDSGWLTEPDEDMRGIGRAIRKTHFFPASPWVNLTGYTVMVRSDNTVHDPQLATINDFEAVPSGAIVRAPDSFIQAGGFPAGRCITDNPLRIRRGSGPLSGPEVLAFEGKTAGGQSYGADAYGFDATEPIELLVTRFEAAALQREVGAHPQRPFYVALDPGADPEFQTYTSFWAILKQLSKPRPLGRYRADGEMLFSMEVQFEEKV